MNQNHANFHSSDETLFSYIPREGDGCVSPRRVIQSDFSPLPVEDRKAMRFQEFLILISFQKFL